MAGGRAAGAAIDHRRGFSGRGGGCRRQRITKRLRPLKRSVISAGHQIGDGAFLIAAVEQLQQHRQIHAGKHVGFGGGRDDANRGVIRTAAEQIDQKQHIIRRTRRGDDRLILADQILRPLAGHERDCVHALGLAKDHRSGIDEFLGKPPVAGNN